MAVLIAFECLWTF